MKEGLRAFTAYFATINEEEFEAYAALYKSVPVKKMDHLFSYGKMIRSIYYVDKGLLRGYYHKDGNEYTMGFHFAPFIITDISSLREKTPCTMNVQALKESECYECDTRNWRH